MLTRPSAPILPPVQLTVSAASGPLPDVATFSAAARPTAVARPDAINRILLGVIATLLTAAPVVLYLALVRVR